MNRFKILTLLCLLFAGFMLLGCSDGNSQVVEKKSSGKTNDGRDLVVFERGELDEFLFKIDTVYITDTSFFGRLFFKNLLESKTPEPGDIIASSITKNAPYGFLYRVAEVNKEGDITIISVIYASIAEAVEEADIEFEIPLVYDEEDDQSGILKKSLWGKIKSAVKTAVNTVVEIVKPVIDVIAGNWDVGGTKGQTFSVNKGVSFGNLDNGGDVKLNGSYTLSLTAKIKLKNYSLDYAKMSVEQYKDLNLESNLRGTLSYSNDFELAKFSLPTVEFWIGPVPVVLKNNAIIKAKVEATAQVNMNAILTFSEFSEYGFEYNGGFKKISTCNKDFIYDYKHSAYGSVRMGVLLEFSSMCYGVAGLGLSAGPSLVLKSPELPLSANSTTTLNSDLDVYVDAKLQIFDFGKNYTFLSARTALGNLSNSKTMPTFDFKSLNGFNLKDIASGNLSFPFKIDKSALGFSIVEAGFCMELNDGECIKGPGFGLGRFGKVVGSMVSFEGLAPGTYNIVPYFKSMDGRIHYDVANALKGFIIDSYCGSVKYDPRTQFCSHNEIRKKESITDEQGNSYAYMEIGEQHWLTENLNYYVPGSKCYNDASNYCTQYGKLYDWATAMDLPKSCNTNSCASQINEPHRGICPSGWHIPSNADWNKLLRYADSTNGTSNPYDSPNAGKYLKTTSGWSNYNNDGIMTNGNGTDNYGFSALPGGYGIPDGSFSNRGFNGDWWSASEYDGDGIGDGAYRLDMYGGDKAGWADRSGSNRKFDKSNLFSVRCVKD